MNAAFHEVIHVALASVFQNTLQADVAQAQRVSKTLRQLPPEIAMVMPQRPVDVLAPSQSLDALAQTYASELPTATNNALTGWARWTSRDVPAVLHWQVICCLSRGLSTR